jgi:hypothetical protein
MASEEYITEEMEQEITSINEPFESKITGYARLIKNLTADYEAVKKERMAMQERERLLESRIDWLSQVTAKAMFDCNKLEVAHTAFPIKTVINPDSVQIIDDTLIPNNYIVTVQKMESRIDKVKIKADIKAGVSIPGACITNTLKLKLG